MTSFIKLKDVGFERNLDTGLHSILYQTHLTNRLEANHSRVKFDYIEEKLLIRVDCKCENAFSEACMNANLPLLCKSYITAFEGAYPSSSSASNSTLLIKTADTKLGRYYEADNFNNCFCDICYCPIYYCCCVEPAMDSEEFLAKLRTFPLCRACEVLGENCNCGYKIKDLYKYYMSKVYNGKVLKRLNEVRRLAYISSCNCGVCLNCNRHFERCICDDDYRMFYHFKY